MSVNEAQIQQQLEAGSSISETGWLLQIKCQLGFGSVTLPNWLLSRTGLILDDCGVSQKSSLIIFEAVWEGLDQTITLPSPYTGEDEEITLIKNGETVRLGSGKGSPKAKLTYLIQQVQCRMRKFSDNEWYCTRSNLPTVVNAITHAQRVKEALLERVIIPLHDAALDRYLERLDELHRQVKASIEQEQTALAVALRTDDGEALPDSEAATETLQQTLDLLEQLDELKGTLEAKFPTIEEIREAFVVTNTTPRKVPSISEQLAGHQDVMTDLVKGFNSDTELALQKAVQNGIEELSGAMPAFISSLQDELAATVSEALGQLTEAAQGQKKGSIRKLVEKKLSELAVIQDTLAELTSLDKQHLICQDTVDGLRLIAGTLPESGGVKGDGLANLQRQLEDFRNGATVAVELEKLESMGVNIPAMMGEAAEPADDMGTGYKGASVAPMM